MTASSHSTVGQAVLAGLVEQADDPDRRLEADAPVLGLSAAFWLREHVT